MNSPQPAADLAASDLRTQGRRPPGGDDLPDPAGPAPDGGHPPDPAWTRRLVNVLVATAVIAVAGATFIFSYAGVHAIALLGGVSAQLAWYYPGLFDAVLVIACVAAVMLRDGHWWSRLWAWLVIVVVLGGIGTSDVLHAMNYTLRHRPTEGIVAAAPAVAVLLAFSLLLTLLRQSRTRAPSASAAADITTEPTAPVPVSVPTAAVPVAPPAGPVPYPADGLGPEQDAVPDETAQETRTPTAPSEVLPADGPAVPTVDVPAMAPPPVPPRPQGIRYAGSNVRNTPPSPDYWDDEQADQFTGLVYRASDDDDQADEAAHPNPPEPDDDAPPFVTAPFASMPRLNRVRSMPTPPADEDE